MGVRYLHIYRNETNVNCERQLFPGEKLCFTEGAPTKTIINVPLSGFGCTGKVKSLVRSAKILNKWTQVILKRMDLQLGVEAPDGQPTQV